MRTSRSTPPMRDDLADAGHRQQFARHGVVDEPRQRFFVHTIGRDRERQDRLARGVHFADDRFFEIARQIGADVRYRRAHVVQRFEQVFLEVEHHHGGRHAFGDGRRDVFDVADGRDRVFDLAGHFGFELRRRGALHDRRHRDRRKIHVGQVGDVEMLEAVDAGERQQNERDDRRDRLTDRPGGEVAAAAHD